jgi:choline dehydrogenase
MSDGPQFDYVVVGAGSAGAPLAARLSEDPASRVLLLEAGRDYPTVSETPPDVLDSRNLASMDHDWGFTAVPVPGRTIPYRRGKVVGGCSAMNSCAALWGRRQDFDEWMALGNPEWGWDKVEPYFRDLETDQDYPDPPHGISGPVPITRFKDEELIPIQRAFRDGCRTVGLADLADFNNSDNEGVGPWPMNRVKSTRISAATAFLEEARSRPTLTIRPNAVVNRVVLNGKRVVGVELIGGEFLEGKRIVLSAGAVGSPAILLRSAIGPAHDLAALGITPYLDLPGVGARLWDHPSVPIRLVPKTGHCVPGRDPRFQMAARFTLRGSSDTNEAMLVLVTHMDLRPFPALMNQIGAPVVALLNAAMMRPRGHGRLSLRSADPNVQPEIDLGFTSDPEDIQALMLATRVAWSVACSEPLSREIERIAGLDQETVGSDELLKHYVLKNLSSFHHALGTAPMGREGDPNAVVDQHGKVHGVENLWIADASIIPSIPRVIPNMICMVIGKRIGHWLAAEAISGGVTFSNIHSQRSLSCADAVIE